jgi:hypothetical protein
MLDANLKERLFLRAETVDRYKLHSRSDLRLREISESPQQTEASRHPFPEARQHWAAIQDAALLMPRNWRCISWICVRRDSVLLGHILKVLGLMGLQRKTEFRAENGYSRP